MKIELEQIGSFAFDIVRIAAMNQRWPNQARFVMSQPRPTDALLFCCGSDAKLTYPNGDSVTFQRGTLCLIPHGAMYTWNFYNEHNGSEISCMLFEFLLKNEEGEILEFGEKVEFLDDGHGGRLRQLYEVLITEYARPQVSYPRIKAAAFSLLAAVCEICRANMVSEQKYRCIYKGIQYLEEDPHQEKSIAELAEMCNVSINYFERLFREHRGMSPVKYRQLRKCERAKGLLETSVLSLEQIAEELNFSDCAYFCRSFKKYFGMTPTEYRRRNSDIHME